MRFQWARAGATFATALTSGAMLLAASAGAYAQATPPSATPAPSAAAPGTVAPAATPAAAATSAPSQAGASGAPATNPGKSAASVVASVQAFYDQTKTVETEFWQTYFNRIYDKYDHSKGSVKFAKPGRMRWDYAAPNGKVIVSDGKRLVIYEPGEESEPGQVFERAISDSELPQALAFLTGTGKLADDFTFRLLDAAAQGFPTGYVLELLPKKPSPHYERILFYVDGDAKRSGLVHRVLIVDSAGNRNRIDFKAPKFNRALDAKTFAWQPPKNARKVNP